jgi:antitoxin component YwqK of YwqJK toxin-antitoxin module
MEIQRPDHRNLIRGSTSQTWNDWFSGWPTMFGCACKEGNPCAFLFGHWLSIDLVMRYLSLSLFLSFICLVLPGMSVAELPLREQLFPSAYANPQSQSILWESEFWISGRIKRKTPYVGGIVHGEVTEYWDVADSPVQSKIQYENGLKNGPAKTWDHNGNPLSERNYRDDKLVGQETQYHPASKGKVKVRRLWQNNRLEGTEYRFDSQGRLRSEFNWVHNKRHGLSTIFGFNGEINSQEQWNEGVLDWRKEFEYFELADGAKENKSIETFNSANQLHGKAEYWRQPGIREKTLYYVDGKLSGLCEFYDESGQLDYKEQWVNGERTK